MLCVVRYALAFIFNVVCVILYVGQNFYCGECYVMRWRLLLRGAWYDMRLPLF